MPTNVEVKARVQDLPELRRLVEELSGSKGELLHQEDTFFRIRHGRLKLRVVDGGGGAAGPRGQLIYYERKDSSDPRPSNYMIYAVSQPDALKQVLAASLGVRGVVRKERRLYMVGTTRVHLDIVEGLGQFVELEVLLDADLTVADGRVEAIALIAALGIAETDLVGMAYIDLLERE